VQGFGPAATGVVAGAEFAELQLVKEKASAKANARGHTNSNKKRK
jgi:hypothetical protein